MAHELNFTDGAADFLSVRQSAWHQLGIILPDHPSYADALKLANLDYEVEKRPTFVNIGDTFTPSRHAFVTVRADTGKELGAVGTGYEPIQNRDALRAIEPLVDTGVLKIETAGVLRDGADAWLLGSFDVSKFGPVVREVFADEVVPYALIANNHVARRAATVALTPIRVVCANTLGAAERDMDRNGRSIAIAHTGDAPEKMIEAATTLFQGIIERYEVVAQQYRTLKARVLTEQEFRRAVLDVIAPDPRQSAQFNPDARTAESVVARWERKTTEVTRLWTAGRGHVADHSAWEAYNAVVEAIDHDRDLFPTRSGTWRAASLLDGTLGRSKQVVLDSLVTLATA